MKLNKLPLLFLVALVAIAAAGQSVAQRPAKAPKPAYVEPAENFGYMPPPVDVSHLKSVFDEYSRPFLQAPTASWDWRGTGVTSVKNQNPYGTCWCFASLGDLESKILIYESYGPDYSELNMQACNPTSTNCNAGGNAWMSANYLSLLGSVDEACNPYPGGCPTPACVNPSCSFLKQVTEWWMLPEDDTAIKNVLQSQGPLYVSMYASFPGFGTYDGSYCITYSGDDPSNHAVLIVGYDDDGCDGAGNWIVKNSWGTSWGDNGFFYISYAAPSFGHNPNVITGWKEYDPQETIHYYDEWGWWTSVGWSDQTDWGLVELAHGTNGEYLTHVDFWATSGPCNYTIWVYDDFDGSTAPINLLAGPITGSTTYAGYYSVELPSHLLLTPGDPVYLTMQFNTPGYGYPIPADDSGPMESAKTYVSNTGTSWTDLGNGPGGYAMGDVGIRGRISPPVQTGECSREGDPGFYGAPLGGGTMDVFAGATYTFYLAPINWGAYAGAPPSCQGTDTFCVHAWDTQGWAITGQNADDPPLTLDECWELPGGYYDPTWEVDITVPCEASICDWDTLWVMFGYCDVNEVCALPGSMGCEDCYLSVYAGDPYPNVDYIYLHVVEAPPALYILQDSLFTVEQGQTAAYVPFGICNGDPCAPPTDYSYNIVSKGHVGGAINTSGTIADVPGGECEDAFGIIDAGAAEICDIDTLTIIAWDTATGTVYDTCVQIIHVIEPIPVPLFSTPVLVIVALGMVLAAALVLRRKVASKA